MVELQYGTVEFNIKACRSAFIVNYPFYGYILQQMKWEENNDIGTMGTNGTTIFYNAKWFNNLTISERAFLVGHELLHVLFYHINRLGSRDPTLWNIATDYAINYLLVKGGIGKMPYNRKTQSLNGLYDERFADMYAEEIYEILKKENPSKKSAPKNHDNWKFENNNQKNKSIIPSENNNLDIKDLIPKAHAFAQLAGKIPEELIFVIEKFIDPKIDWKTLLNNSITSLFKGETSWARPNKRFIHDGIILPSLIEEETVDICVAIDTSGSINDSMKIDFLSEIHGILKYYPCFTLSIWSFDTMIHNFKRYESYEINEVEKYKLKGGGGTDISENFKYMKKKNICPKQFVCFTDGDTIEDTKLFEDYCKTIWIIHSNRDPKVPFGQMSKYERSIT